MDRRDPWNPRDTPPDNHRVYRPIVKHTPKRKWWEKEERIKLPECDFEWTEVEHREHVWKNGILDTLFEGPEMEAEIERCAKIMDELQ